MCWTWPLRFQHQPGRSLRERCWSGTAYLRSLDDKHRFVVDQVFIAILSENSILLYSVTKQSIANVPGRLAVVFAQNRFQLAAGLFVAVVVNSIGMKNENIPRTHERDLRHIGRGELFLPY